MGFLVSPGVEVNEIDLTNVVPAVSTSIGAFAGNFKWGPVEQVVSVGSENELASTFGKPDIDATRGASFFTAASFLKYGIQLKVVRAVDASALNATAGGSTKVLSSVSISNAGAGYVTVPSVAISGVSTSGGSLPTIAAKMGVDSTGFYILTQGSGYAVDDIVEAQLSSSSSDTEAQFKVTSVNSGAVTGISLLSAGEYTSIAQSTDNTNNRSGGAGSPITLADETFTNLGSSTNGRNLSVDSSAATGLVIAGMTLKVVGTTVDFGSNLGGSVTITVDAPTGGRLEDSPKGIIGSGNSPAKQTVTTATMTASLQDVTGVLIKNEEAFDNGLSTIVGKGSFIARCPGAAGNGISVYVYTASAFGNDVTGTGITNVGGRELTGAYLAGQKNFDRAPNAAEKEIHVLVIDGLGYFTGTKGAVLETYSQVMSDSGDGTNGEGLKKDDGSNNYYVDVINENSQFIYANPNDSEVIDVSNATEDTLVFNLSGGTDVNESEDEIFASTGAFNNAFGDAETVDVNLMIGGAVSSANGSNIISYAATRKDAVAFVSPPVNLTNTAQTTATKTSSVKGWGDAIDGTTTGSYGVMDSSAVYVYDRYNDRNLWIGASGLIAGLCAGTDDVAEPWFSPAGFNRGGLRGVVKLGLNPSQSQRDDLYKARINPIVSFPGQGVVLFGDKTAQSKPSAFDRINVRRLFLVLEKAIATAAKFQLFELNDEFTRAQFRNLVEPFLRDVKGRRGITDFLVVCDETNNTGQVIDTNRFVADIFIKPARSINFITLNFIATRTGVEFSEVAGNR